MSYNEKHFPSNRTSTNFKVHNEGSMSPFWFNYEEPVAEPGVEPVAEQGVDPVVEPTVEPVAEPTVEPVAGPSEGPTKTVGGSSQAEKEKERKLKYAATIRMYKLHYTTVDVSEALAKKVQTDKDFDFGDKPYLRGHEIGGNMGYSDSSSSDDDQFYALPVESDPRSDGTTTIWYNEDWEVPYFQVGMKFTDHNQFKRDIQKYAIKWVAGIKAINNEPKRQRYQCSPGCPWVIHASPDSRVNAFTIKTYTWGHNCRQVHVNKKCTYKYLADMYYDKIRKEPSYTCRAMMIDVFKKMSIVVRYSKCVKTKIFIFDKMEGNFLTEYAVVQGYANYLKEVNPNNTVVVVSTKKTRMPGSPSVFERMYLCLDVLKDGFKNGCRRVIGIDGTHLKGVCKGTLLAAVGKVGNSQMYPVAWAVVDVESHETWCWFLKLVIKDLELGVGDNLTILSDKHKGIISARKLLLPNAKVRYCSRHLYGNLRNKHFPDAVRRRIYWRIVFSFEERQFRKHMKQLYSVCRSSHDALLAYDVTQWCRAFFNHTTTNEDATNNITESFNGWIREQRALPIISMFEGISDKIMEKRADFYNSMLDWEKQTDICPYPFERLKKRVQEANHCDVVWDGHNSFRVKDRKYLMGQVVDLVTKTCSCGYWQLTGVPCAHLVRVCLDRELKPEDSVSPYLKVDMYRKVYERLIQCTRGREAWEGYKGPKLEPPVLKRRPGRPQKNKIPSTEEVKTSAKGGVKYAWLGREGRKLRCTGCDKLGHNIRTCPKVKAQTAQADTGASSQDGSAPTNESPFAGRNEADVGGSSQAGSAPTNESPFAGRNQADFAATDEQQFTGDFAPDVGQDTQPDDAPHTQADVAQDTQHADGDDEVEVLHHEVNVDRAALQRFRRTLRAESRKRKKQQKRVVESKQTSVSKKAKAST